MMNAGKSVDDGLEATLMNLPKLLKKREQDLQKKEEELKRLKNTIEEEHPNLGQPGDVLQLNVGGTCIDVLRRTLTQVEGSMLASMFSGRWDDSLDKDQEGNFFIDQPIELFKPLVNFLRAKSCETPATPPAQSPMPEHFPMKGEYTNFCRMVDYYGMTLGIFPVSIYRLDSTKQESLVAGHPGYAVETEDWASYALLPDKRVHDRQIESFQVAFGQSQTNCQVGWMYWGTDAERNQFYKNAVQNDRGAGYWPNSVAFDVTRSGIVSNGAFVQIPDLPVGDGAVFQCKRNTGKTGFEWFIDGWKFAVAGGQDIHQCNIGIPYTAFTYRTADVPCISVKGRFQITAIQMSD